MKMPSERKLKELARQYQHTKETTQSLADAWALLSAPRPTNPKTVIFITARSHPFSPLLHHGTNGHADL